MTAAGIIARRSRPATGFTPGFTPGFTLVELMVVIVIIGLASSAALLALPDPRGNLRDEAEALAARLLTARDLAIVSGRDIAVRFDAGGYDFSQRRAGGFASLPERALRPRRWGRDVAATASIAGGGALLFDAAGLATPAEIVLRRDDAGASISVDTAGAVRVAGR